MKASKLRLAAAGLFAAVGLSLLGSLAAPIASARRVACVFDRSR